MAAFDVILLDGVKLENGELSPQDKVFLQKFTNAEHLGLSNTGLKSLRNLPLLPKMEKLDLSDNILAGDDLH